MCPINRARGPDEKIRYLIYRIKIKKNQGHTNSMCKWRKGKKICPSSSKNNVYRQVLGHCQEIYLIDKRKPPITSCCVGRKMKPNYRGIGRWHPTCCTSWYGSTRNESVWEGISRSIIAISVVRVLFYNESHLWLSARSLTRFMNSGERSCAVFVMIQCAFRRNNMFYTTCSILLIYSRVNIVL